MKLHFLASEIKAQPLNSRNMIRQLLLLDSHKLSYSVQLLHLVKTSKIKFPCKPNINQSTSVICYFGYSLEVYREISYGNH